MSATIDLTRRARIRALAVRMHRSGVAGVFLVGGGSPSVDESALTDNQRAEAAQILEEQTASSVDIKDVETAASVAAIIPRYVKPSCPVCHGEGIARRGRCRRYLRLRRSAMAVRSRPPGVRRRPSRTWACSGCAC